MIYLCSILQIILKDVCVEDAVIRHSEGALCKSCNVLNGILMNNIKLPKL